MKTDLMQVASFENAFQAEQARLILEENGILAFLDGSHANTVLSHVGTALGGVRLLVRDCDAVKAAEILEAVTAAPDTAEEAWFCGKCQEEVDAGFERCWSCGLPRAEVEQPFPADSTESSGGNEVEEFASSDEVASPPEMPEANPYASPMGTAAQVLPGEKRASMDPEAEAILLRAWRASLIGIVLFPPLLNFYSMYLLIRAASVTSEFSGVGIRRYYGALLINLVIGCFGSLLCGSFFYFAFLLISEALLNLVNALPRASL